MFRNHAIRSASCRSVCMDSNPSEPVTGMAFVSSNSLFGRDLKLANFLLEAFDDRRIRCRLDFLRSV